MTRLVLQKSLRRSRTANRIGLVLFFALLAVLVMSFYEGLRTL
jgi:hypothetical protein